MYTPGAGIGVGATGVVRAGEEAARVVRSVGPSVCGPAPPGPETAVVGAATTAGAAPLPVAITSDAAWARNRRTTVDSGTGTARVETRRSAPASPAARAATARANQSVGRLRIDMPAAS